MTFNESLENILKQKVKTYAIEFDKILIGILLNDSDRKKPNKDFYYG